MLAAQASMGKKLAEGSDSGDFGDLYPDYRWISQTNEVGTNGLFEVDFGVYRHGGGSGGAVDSHLCILLYRPDSPHRPGT
jgi:hypothetical protein